MPVAPGFGSVQFGESLYTFKPTDWSCDTDTEDANQRRDWLKSVNGES